MTTHEVPPQIVRAVRAARDEQPANRRSFFPTEKQIAELVQDVEDMSWPPSLWEELIAAQRRLIDALLVAQYPEVDHMNPTTTEDLLIRHAAWGADIVAMQRYNTEAERTKAIIRRALDVWVSNGLITINDQETWPDMIYLY